MSKKRNPDEVIQNYLEQQNRPYSAIDIFNNLHKEFGKTAVEKSLENLSEDGKIIKKTYGKQKVYAPSQDKYGDYNEEEIKKTDQKIKELQQELEELTGQSKKQDSEINGLNSQLTTEVALKEISKFQKENESLGTRVNNLKSGTKLISKEERLRIFQKRDKNVMHWRKRKRMVTDILDCILEGYPKKKKDLLDDAGIETDEEAGVLLPK